MEAKQNITLSNETATWLQFVSETNDLGQRIYDTILQRCGEDCENAPNTDKIFAEMGEYINKLSQALLQRATTSIANNMASGGTTA